MEHAFDGSRDQFLQKNIRIEEDKKLKHFWSLKPNTKTGLKDEISGAGIKSQNLIWLIEDHHNWKKLKGYVSANFQGAAYDSINSALYMDFVTHLTVYNIKTGYDTTIEYKNQSP